MVLGKKVLQSKKFFLWRWIFICILGFLFAFYLENRKKNKKM